MSQAKTKKADAGGQSLWSYLLTVLLSAGVGAGVTLLIMSQRPSPEFHPASSSPPAGTLNTAPDVAGFSAGDTTIDRGNAAYDQQRWPEAIPDYEQAIASGLDTPDVRTDLGNALRFSGQPEKALEQYAIAQKLNPQHENSLFNQIALFVEGLHEPARAVPVCEEFIRRFPASDKIPAVQQQLARAKNPDASAPASDVEARNILSRWLPKQQKSKP